MTPSGENAHDRTIRNPGSRHRMERWRVQGLVSASGRHPRCPVAPRRHHRGSHTGGRVGSLEPRLRDSAEQFQPCRPCPRNRIRDQGNPQECVRRRASRHQEIQGGVRRRCREHRSLSGRPFSRVSDPEGRQRSCRRKTSAAGSGNRNHGSFVWAPPVPGSSQVRQESTGKHWEERRRSRYRCTMPVNYLSPSDRHRAASGFQGDALCPVQARLVSKMAVSAACM